MENFSPGVIGRLGFDYPEAVAHSHLRQRGTVRTVTDRIPGKFEMPGFALRFRAACLPPGVQWILRGRASNDTIPVPRKTLASFVQHSAAQRGVREEKEVRPWEAQ